MTVDGISEVRLEGARHAAVRAAKAGAMGAGFGGVMTWIMVESARCQDAVEVRQGGGWGCAVEGLLYLLALAVGAFPVGWLLLRGLDVRPAWAVALLGVAFSPGVLDLAGLLTRAVTSQSAPWAVIPAVAAAYAMSALVVAPRLAVPYRVTAGALALGAPLAAQSAALILIR